MNGTVAHVNSLWTKAKLASPAFVRHEVLPGLNDVKEITRLLFRPYLPVRELSGNGPGGPLTAVFINVSFSGSNLQSILFQDKSSEKRVGQVPFWDYRRIGNWPTGDLVIVEGSRRLIRLLSRRRAFTFPQYVHHVVDVSGDPQAVRERFHHTINKKIVALRKYGFQYATSNSNRDFEEFYRQMYLPAMGERHGDMASPMEPREANEHFRHGFLLQVKREGEWVSGLICRPEDDTVINVIIGVRNGDRELIRTNVLYETVYDSILWANEHGYRAVNFLGSVPFLAASQFQHKRKWGSSILIPSRLHRQLWLQVRRRTPAVDHFLKENPFITIDQQGTVAGLILVDDQDAVDAKTTEMLRDRYATPGLSSLVVRSIGWFDGIQNRDLVIPLTASGNPLTPDDAPERLNA